MRGNIAAPSAEALTTDLVALVESGLTSLRRLKVPALRAAAALLTDTPELEAHLQIEAMLGRAIGVLDDGRYGDAALELVGLAPGARVSSRSARRGEAGRVLDLSGDSFRRRYERTLLQDIADRILVLCAELRLRDARVQLEQRHPAESRLAVQWVERFEAYHRMWTPAWALAADLTAYRATLLDKERPYDEYDDQSVQVYSQEEQADGYAKFALYRWASFQWHLRDFGLRYGGMWLLSSTEAETRLSDLTYGITWHVTTFNERDQSWLRNAIGQSPGEELDRFLALLATSSIGAETLQEWVEWCSDCDCTPSVPIPADRHFASAQTDPGVVVSCQVHQVIASCDSYCRTVEAEWLKIADWYHLSADYTVGARPSALYNSWRIINRDLNQR